MEKTTWSLLVKDWESIPQLRQRAKKLQLVSWFYQVYIQVLHSKPKYPVDRDRCLGLTTLTGPCCFIFLLKSFEWVIDTEVFTVGKTLNRDTLKNNEEVLTAAVRHLGLRVSVPTLRVHVGELYNFMDIDCPSHLTQNSFFPGYCSSKSSKPNCRKLFSKRFWFLKPLFQPKG